MITCEGCGERDVPEKTQLMRLPRVPILIVIRFGYDSNGRRSKEHRHLAYNFRGTNNFGRHILVKFLSALEVGFSDKT